jgi:hypothetical protein
MANPAESEVQNLLPVQAYFNVDGSFNTFIGQNKPFYATPDPQQSGLQITNSTINSSVIGGITPAAGNFTTATVLSQPVGATDVVNLLALQSYAAGISWKQPCVAATLTNITLSGLQTIDGKAVVAGDRVLVKDQSTAANNGIYIASASAWTRSSDANSWDELICAISFIEYGTQAGGAWFCTAQDGGTLGVTAVNWAQFTTSATYSAGTGLTLTGTVFSITPVGTASTYGSASTVPVFTTNASGQVSAVTNTNIAIGATQITSGTIDSARLSGSYTGITGLGTLTDLTVTNNIVGSITGNAATATSATTATNIAGGAAGSVPYQTASGATGFLAAGTNGQVLTLASGVPSWATPTTGTVTSVSGAGTVNGLTLTGTVTTSGSLTLGGTLDLSSPPAIGGTAANTVRGTTVTATSSFVGSFFDASGSGGGSLRTSGGSACLQWGGGGGVNVTIDGPINMNGANSAIQINPTGTGTVSIAPAGALTVNPTTASTMNNVAIGGTTPLAGTFTDLRVNGTISLAGTTGTAGFVLTSNGASAPTWQANANGLTITDDTTTNATRYLAFTSATSGSITGQNVSSTKLQYNPSTGTLSSTVLASDSVTSNLMTDSQGGSVAPVSSVMRNRIINGAMMIDVRNSGASITVGANGSGYPVDRFYIENFQSGTITAQQSTTAPTGYINSIIHTVTVTDTPAAGDYFFESTSIEGLNMADLGWGTASAKTVTLSFWVRSSVTGTYGIGLRNSAGNRSYVATYTINSANTFEYKTITIPGDTSGTWLTNNELGVRIFWDLGSGSNFNGTANSWNAGSFWRASGCVNFISNSGATLFIAGVQLEKGEQATGFEYRQYGTELALCQRYTYRHSAEGDIDNFAPLGMGRYYDTNLAQLYVPFKVTMRTSPSSVTQVGNIFVNNTGLGGSAITLSFNETSSSGATLTGTATTGTTAGNATTFYADSTSNAALIFNAEL